MTPWYPMFFLAPCQTFFSDQIGPHDPCLILCCFGKNMHSQDNLDKRFYPNIPLNGFTQTYHWMVGFTDKTWTHAQIALILFSEKMNETTCAKKSQNQDVLPDFASSRDFCFDVAIHKMGSRSLGACVQLVKTGRVQLYIFGPVVFLPQFFTRFFCESIVTWRSSDLELQTRICAVLCKQTRRCGGWFACKFHSRCRRCQHSKSCLAMK